ncbi:Condensation domain-containing protein [Variovorax sp. YR266]|uniref:condensation domain-containing protein n=1 Tax=Variovorax sp. YR266 TaxID=1884386 RepID=UPI00089A1419|nr:condensation domain-containing protein [Variovorax sp. YR266]SDZ70688.1 Condensation domain-containing protein [Variovorax sp. YR266]
MKFTDMPSLSLSAGRLTVWRAHVQDGSTAAWVADRRRASHVQEALIACAVEAAGGGPLPPSWLGCAFDLPGELDANAFAAALRDWANRHETLRSHLAPSSSSAPENGLQRMTLPAGAVSIRCSTVADFADGRKLARHLEALFDSEAGPLTWPGYVCTTISSPHATTICLAADHSLMDGYSVCQTVYELQTLYAAALALRDGKPAPPPLPPTASYLDFAEAERTAADALTTEHEFIVRWRQFLAKGGGRLPEFPVPVSDASNSSGAQTGGRSQFLDASATRDFAEVCRAAGGGFASGLLACFAKASHEITGSDEFRTMVPIDTQPSAWQSSIGWYVGMAPVAFPLGATDSFAEAVRSAFCGFDGAKELARIPMLRVAQLLGRPLRDPFMISYMDFRRTLGAHDWNRWRAIALRSRCTDPDEVCLWISRMHEGLFVDYRHPATGPAAIAVSHYVSRAKQLLAAVASTGCWAATPRPRGEDHCL